MAGFPVRECVAFRAAPNGPGLLGCARREPRGAADDDRLGLADAPRPACRSIDGRTTRTLRDRPRAAVASSHRIPGPDPPQDPRDIWRQPVLRPRARDVLLDPNADRVPGLSFPAPSTLPELLATRLARISPPIRRALLAASALARPTADLVLAATAGDGVSRATLDEATAADVITQHAGVFRFSHPLLSSVVYAEASGAERRRLHRRLADLVVDPEEQARHLGLSTDAPNRDIAATLERAARRAASRGAPDAAAELMERAVDLTPSSSTDEVIRRKLDTADQYIVAGQHDGARPFSKA